MIPVLCVSFQMIEMAFTKMMYWRRGLKRLRFSLQHGNFDMLIRHTVGRY